MVYDALLHSSHAWKEHFSSPVGCSAGVLLYANMFLKPNYTEQVSHTNFLFRVCIILANFVSFLFEV